MRHKILSCLAGLALTGFFPTLVYSQSTSTEAQSASSVCTFEDGGQMSVRYDAARVSREKLSDGHPWTPGDVPMLLFTSTALKLNNTEIPTGAYSLFFMPGKEQWTLVVNKDVSGRSYSKQQDVVRAPMGIGSLDDPGEQASIVLGHLAPKECSLRLYYGKIGAWVEFNEP
jgi:hypothetical protein